MISQTSTYSVTGMTCGHCVTSVTEEVQEIPGVESVGVALETGAVSHHQCRVHRRRRRSVRRRRGRLPARMNFLPGSLVRRGAGRSVRVGARDHRVAGLQPDAGDVA